MPEETLESRIQGEKVGELASKARYYFLRLAPNGADVHKRNTLAAGICQLGIYVKRKNGRDITGLELKEKEPERYQDLLDDVQKAIEKYGFTF